MELKVVPPFDVRVRPASRWSLSAPPRRPRETLGLTARVSLSRFASPSRALSCMPAIVEVTVSNNQKGAVTAVAPAGARRLARRRRPAP